MSSDWFRGDMVSLLQVTKNKFGQPGVDAIAKYPVIAGAMINPNLYMKETGGGKFTIYDSSNTEIVSGINGGHYIIGEHPPYKDMVIYEPLGSKAPVAEKSNMMMMYLLLGGGLFAVVGFLFLRNN